MTKGYSRHLFLFADEYTSMDIEVHFDALMGLPYILLGGGKKLYFKRGLSEEKIKRMYKVLLMEQDVRSPHHYFDSFDEVKGRVFVDVGCAEAFTSLYVIEHVEHVYLFETEELWIEALRKTFEPWADKVTIINKFIGNKDEGQIITLNKFFEDKPINNLFLKMDIEGAERYALAGSTEIFQNAVALRFAICTYHLDDDEEVIGNFLKKYDCMFVNQKGYFRHKLRSVLLRGYKNKVGDE